MQSNNFPTRNNIGQSALPPTPYFLLGDDVFAPDENLVKPYAHCTAMGMKRFLTIDISELDALLKMHLAYYVQVLEFY